MEVRKYSNISEALLLKNDWNEFVKQAGANIAHSFEWTHALWNSNVDLEKEIYVYKDLNRMVSIFPIYKQVVKKKIVHFSTQEMLSNIYGPHNTLILDSNNPEMVLVFKQHIDTTDCEIFVVHSVVDDSLTMKMLMEGKAKKYWGLEVEPHNKSPYLQINKTWEEYLDSRGSKFRWDLKNRQKLIKQKYKMDIITFDSVNNIDGFFESMYKIEKNSWKEETETSITTNQNQKLFYELFLREIADGGKLLSYVMFFDDEPVAYDMGIVDGKRYMLLKTSYDKSYQKIGPGMALREFGLESAFNNGLTEYDFLGKDEAWKLKWANTVRNHSNLYIYNVHNAKSFLYYKVKMAYNEYTKIK